MRDFAGVRVLLVEDEGLIAIMLEEMLEDLGCEVVASVSSIIRAQEAIRSFDVEVALLDVNLSGETSFEFARELGRRDTPFIFSTGYGDRALPQDLQGNIVLTKPFVAINLQQAFESVLPFAD